MGSEANVNMMHTLHHVTRGFSNWYTLWIEALPSRVAQI